MEDGFTNTKNQVTLSQGAIKKLDEQMRKVVTLVTDLGTKIDTVVAQDGRGQQQTAQTR